MWLKLILVVVAGSLLLGGYWLFSNVFFLESAHYKLVLKEGDFEIREYPELVVVTTPMESTEGDSAFGRLFQFIQGENASEAKIAMTTPVFVDEGKMSFVIPKETRQQGVPDPTAREVTVESRLAVRVGAYRFSGVANESRRTEALEKLKTWMVGQGLESLGDPTFAYYDAPFIPGPLRRNEVLLQSR
jgi:hypothetical protein